MLFGKKKKVIDKKLKVIFDIDSGSMVHVKCPYCNEEIDKVYVYRLDRTMYTSCPHCLKEFGDD